MGDDPTTSWMATRRSTVELRLHENWSVLSESNRPTQLGRLAPNRSAKDANGGRRWTLTTDLSPPRGAL